MARMSLAVIAVSLLAAAPALAESPLVVMDANNEVVGEVISADMDLKSVTMLYRLTTGGFALLEIDLWGFEMNNVFSFYELSGCAGSPLFEIPPGNTPRMVTYLHRITWEFNQPGGAHSIRRYPGTATGSSITTRSYYHPTLGCLDFSPTLRTVVAPEFVEYTRTPPPPFHVELNPILLRDGFQTGDMSRWSNY